MRPCSQSTRAWVIAQSTPSSPGSRRYELSVALATEEIALRVDDPERRFRAVHLVDELSKRVPPRPFIRQAGSSSWELHFARPPVDRMEYLLELESRDGTAELVPDPGNPLRAAGAFGEKSVLEFAEYEPPGWLEDKAPTGDVRRIRLRSGTIGASVHGLLWSPPQAFARETLPLLVAHDGPEYATFSSLLRLLDVASARRWIPPIRAALLAPVDRNQHYSASERYATALAHDILPALRERAPTRTPPIGLGASLGALALLHAHRSHPSLFGGLCLQSGSFFRARTDVQESRFPYFRRITRFLDRVHASKEWPDPIPVTITCGTAEENLGNNRAAAAALAAQGYPVAFHEQRDAHNWVSWRDSFDPPLVKLLTRVWE